MESSLPIRWWGYGFDPRRDVPCAPCGVEGHVQGPNGLFTLQGDLKAPNSDQSRGDSDHRISFQFIDNFMMSGAGSLDGQGPSAWPYSTCSGDPRRKQLLVV